VTPEPGHDIGGAAVGLPLKSLLLYLVVGTRGAALLQHVRELR
jgi:hypothetical protein